MATKPSSHVGELVSLFPLEGRPDDELVLLARGGRREAFDALVRRHQASVLKVAAKYLGDATSARDACQSAFLEIYRGLPRYRPQGRFVFFLRRVVLNQCRMAARHARIGERAVESHAAEPRQPTTLPDEALLAHERRRDVERALLELSDRLREVMVLRHAGDHTLEETAEILQLPLGTVKSRHFTAMEKLKSTLGGVS